MRDWNQHLWIELVANRTMYSLWMTFPNFRRPKCPCLRRSCRFRRRNLCRLKTIHQPSWAIAVEPSCRCFVSRVLVAALDTIGSSASNWNLPTFDLMPSHIRMYRPKWHRWSDKRRSCDRLRFVSTMVPAILRCIHNARPKMLSLGRSHALRPTNVPESNRIVLPFAVQTFSPATFSHNSPIFDPNIRVRWHRRREWFPWAVVVATDLLHSKLFAAVSTMPRYGILSQLLWSAIYWDDVSVCSLDFVHRPTIDSTISYHWPSNWIDSPWISLS